jgi:predicted DNA-binding transcriptional regulator YafY
VNRTDRLYALVEELRGAAPKARSARWLADRFEVSVRTVERDLLSLQYAGVPIQATPGPGGGYRLDPAMTLPPLNFSPEEATAVAVALTAGGPIPFGTAGRSALGKIVAAMAESGRQGARELAGSIHLFKDRPLQETAGTMRTVEAALAERRVLRLTYVDKGGSRTKGRLVEPAALVGGNVHWYLIGWCRLRQEGRAFRMDRIETAELSAEGAPAHRLEEVASGLATWVRGLTVD